MSGSEKMSPSPNQDSDDTVMKDPEDAWNSSSESRNPKNWSMPKKMFHTAVPCFIAFEMTFSTSVTVPATGFIQEHFQVSRTKALLALTLYTLGLAFGPFFIAPLSEVFGRKWLYVITLGFLMAFTGGAGAAQNLATLFVCRFLAGFLGSAGLAIGAGTIADTWALGKHGAPAGLFFTLGPFLGPALGPLAGAYVMSDHGNDWRWTQYLIIIIAAPVWVAALFMSETSKAIILSRRGGLLPRDEAGNIQAFPKGFLQKAILRPLRMLLFDPITFCLTIYSGYAYAMIFSYFASSSYVLPLYYDFTLRKIGLSFLSVVIGYLLAAVVFIVFNKTLYARAMRNLSIGDRPAPEHHLYAGMAGSIFLPVGLFWYAWEAHRGGHWAALVASGIPFGFGAFSLFLSTVIYLVDVYEAGAAASAIAANGALRYTMGAVFPLFTVQMYENLGVHWAASTFAFLSILLLPIPWILFKYGHKLRARNNRQQVTEKV